MAGLTLESALLAAIVLVLIGLLSVRFASRPASAIPGSIARYTESLATALAPAWSAGRRIAWRGSETYRFANPLRQCLDLLKANYEILLDGFPRSGNTPRHTQSQIGRVAARTRCHIPGALKRGVDLGKPAVCPIRNPEEAVLSWTIFRRRSLVDPRSSIHHFGHCSSRVISSSFRSGPYSTECLWSSRQSPYDTGLVIEDCEGSSVRRHASLPVSRREAGARREAVRIPAESRDRSGIRALVGSGPEQRPHPCLGCSPSMVSMAHQAGVKVVLTHIVDEMTSSSRSRRFWHRTRNAAVREFAPGSVRRLFPWHVLPAIDQLVYINQVDAETAIEIYGIQRRRTHVIPHGCSTDEIARLQAGAREAASYLVSVGSIVPRKNTAVLARAARRARVPLVFLGKPFNEDDPYFKEFKALVDGEYVIYPGYVSENEKTAWMVGASGFVLASRAGKWVPRGLRSCRRWASNAAFRSPVGSRLWQEPLPTSRPACGGRVGREAEAVLRCLGTDGGLHLPSGDLG